MTGGRRRQIGAIDRMPSGRWRVRLLDPSTSRRMSVGTFRTKAEAETAFAQALSDQGQGAWVAPDQGRLTLGEYATGWLGSRLTARGEPLRPRVRELYESELRLHILPTLGAVPLGRMTTVTIRRWHAGLLAEGPGPSTVAKCYRLLRAILNTAVEDRHLVVNPCSIKGAGIETSEERTIPTMGQVYALADAVTLRFRALVLLAAFGGLRRGELFGLTRGDIDLLHLTVDVRVQRQESRRGEALIGPPKTLAGRRTLALPTEVVPELEAHLARWVSVEPTASVFVGEQGGALRAGVWHKEWDRARRSVGLPHLHLHDLRHVAGTLAAATGAGPGPAPRRSCAARGTPPRRLRFATSTPPTSATACWPPGSTA